MGDHLMLMTPPSPYDGDTSPVSRLRRRFDGGGKP